MAKNFDSEYEIQQNILTKLGGDGTKCFDSQYSILLEILDKIEGGGGGAQIDDDHISTETTWSSSKIVSELADAGFNVLVVQELPATGEAHTLYFVPSADPLTQNAYDEYLYANNAWEQVGSTAVDMSDYYTADEVDALLEDLPHNYIIADADASAGTYSIDISTFYNKTIEENAVQNVQIKIVNEQSNYDVSTNELGWTGMGEPDLIAVPENTATEISLLPLTRGPEPARVSVYIAADGTVDDTKAPGVVTTSTISITGYNIYTFNADAGPGYTQYVVESGHAYIVDSETETSDSYYLPTSSRISEGNVELWLMNTEDGQIWENIHYLITNNSITREVSTGIFGPANYVKLSILTQAQYDALTTKDASTLYIISDAQ